MILSISCRLNIPVTKQIYSAFQTKTRLCDKKATCDSLKTYNRFSENV